MREFAAAVAVLVAGCSSDAGGEDTWRVIGDDLPGALMSVWAAGPDDVWAVGADSGDGSVALHYDGASWERIDTGTSGDLWWVHGFANGPVFFGGEGGMVLRYDSGAVTQLTTPGTGIVFGLWGASPDQMWAVGGNNGGTDGAFVWKLEGDQFALDPGFPTELANTDAIWKVFGRSASDVVMVGTNGTVLRYDGDALAVDDSGASVSLFTVSGNAERYIAVGGFGTGAILENDGSGWVDASPANAPQLIGVVAGSDDAYAVGADGVVYRRGAAGAWEREPTNINTTLPLHAIWLDTAGGVWAAGGQVQFEPLIDGYLLYKGPEEIAEGF